MTAYSMTVVFVSKSLLSLDRMKYWLLSWLVLHVITHETVGQGCMFDQPVFSALCANEFMRILSTGTTDDIIE